jgi:hypothetical protein
VNRFLWIPTVSAAALLLLAPVARAQDGRPLLTKPKNQFFFYQVNLAGGYDSREPGSSWGPADRGPVNQLTLEWLGKSERAIQRGYIESVAATTWNTKIALEYNPAETAGGDPTLDIRLLDNWVRFDTKWDRTSFFLGHRSIPFGQNPRLDPELTFTPAQAPADLGLSRDTGVFFQTPVSAGLDLAVSATAGGFLSGPIATLRNDEGGSLELDDAIDYRDSWLVTGRLGQPSFAASEAGLFASFGELHRATGSLLEISRIGGYWAWKQREDWTLVNQLSLGENQSGSAPEVRVANLLTNAEWFLSPAWRLGVTHTFRFEDPQASGRPEREIGTFFASLSWAISRDARLRLNPFVEWRDTGAPSRESGVLVQMCVGCGLQK